MTLAAATLAAAQAELARGVRETPPGSNDGERIRVYRAPCVRGDEPLHLGPCPWCSLFACFCVHEAWRTLAGYAGLDDPDMPVWRADDRYPGQTPIGYRASVAELWQDAVATDAARREVAAETPYQGALLLFERAGQDPTQGLGNEGHVAIVEAWGPWTYSAISGNDGDAVRRRTWGAGELPPWGAPVGWIAL